MTLKLYFYFIVSALHLFLWGVLNGNGCQVKVSASMSLIVYMGKQADYYGLDGSSINLCSYEIFISHLFTSNHDNLLYTNAPGMLV